MISIRVLWNSKEEKEKALEVALKIAKLYKGSISKIYPNRNNDGGRIYINV